MGHLLRTAFPTSAPQEGSRGVGEAGLPPLGAGRGDPGPVQPEVCGKLGDLVLLS
jgi:hypothetical protein